jgi:hypothetical protein
MKNLWQHMHQRCENPNYPSYARYGGRGIAVCNRWSVYENFVADMGERPTPQHSIDRIDNLGPYSPENCRWATKQQQSNNRRDNHLLTYQDKTQTIAEWARECGLSFFVISQRLQRGATVAQALAPILHPIQRATLRKVFRDLER